MKQQIKTYLSHNAEGTGHTNLADANNGHFGSSVAHWVLDVLHELLFGRHSVINTRVLTKNITE